MDQKKDLFAVPCYLHFPQLMFDIIFYQMCRPRKKENDHLILMKSRAEKKAPTSFIVSISAFRSSFKGISSLVVLSDRPGECSPDDPRDCCR